MKRTASKWVFLVLGISVLLATSAIADTLETVEYRITASTAYETTPTLGNDGTTDLVVYTLKPVVAGYPGAGDIWYQPLVDGEPDGMPVQVTSGPTDDQLNDVSGDYIVYTAYDSVSSTIGAIVLYQISTGIVHTLGRADIIGQPKIYRDRVIWREGGAGASMVMYFNLSWLSSGGDAEVLAGPLRPAYDIQIGDRFAVWAEIADEDGDQRYDFDIFAYNFNTQLEQRVTDTRGISELSPAISGSWVVWQQQEDLESWPPGSWSRRFDVTTIQALNLDTLESRTIVDNGAANFNPSIDGDLITWESNVSGNFDIWVYRISTGESYQLTTEAHDQYLSDVYHDMVAYVDMRRGTEDVYVSTLEFVPDPDIEISPPALNFGQVAVNTTVPLLVTISNVGAGDLTITGLTLTGSSDFSVNSPLPDPIPPDGSTDVQINYTSSDVGSDSGSLVVASNDPDEAEIQVSLAGEGIETTPPPDKQIKTIVDFFDYSVGYGTLPGDGPNPKSAENRRGALRNMLEAVGDLIAAGDVDGACDQLIAAYKKCDGDPRPPDFVAGPAAPELADKIMELIDSLGCSI
jgi:beta propeller repeat protein